MGRGTYQHRAQPRHTGNLITALFPERQIIVRTGARGRHFRLGTVVQLTFVGLLLGLLGWNVVLTNAFIEHAEQVSVREGENLALQQSYETALAEIDGIRGLFASITREIETSQANLIALAERQNGVRKPDRGVRKAGEEPDAGEKATKEPLLSVERDNAALQRRIAAFEQTLARLRDNNADLLRRSSDATGQRISEVEKVLARTGIDPDRLIGRFGRGGPFVPVGRPGLEMKSAPPSDLTLAALHAKYTRWEQVEAAIKRIPLALPILDYEITSGFGARHDPINQLSGIHEGTDFGAPQGTPVQSTAQGRVVHAGWRDRYGMLIEIDHGNGISTRYGHLSRILVKLDQVVEAGTRIGLVGSTGRSSGPHLHYEIRVDEIPRDPLKFISAGNYVLTRK